MPTVPNMPRTHFLRRKPTAIVLAFATAIAVLPHAVVGAAHDASASTASTALIQDGFNNTVTSTATSDGTTYVSGYFTAWGPQTGGGALLDASTATLDRTFPDFDNEVYTSISDGAGGLYVGGYFNFVGSHETSGIAHISADGSVDTGFQVFLNGGALAMVVRDGVLYAGGDFNCVGVAQNPNDDCDAPGDKRRFGLAAFSATGEVLDWNPQGVEYGLVQSMAVSGSTLFVGGSFTQFGPVPDPVLRDNLASFDLASSNPDVPTAWNPDADREVKAMAVSGSTLFVVGFFTQFGPVSAPVLRDKLASFDLASSNPDVPTVWNPQGVNGGVRTMAVSGSTLFVGGSFTQFGPVSLLVLRNNLASFDLASSNPDVPTEWDPNANDDIHSMAVIGSLIYFVGDFTSVGSSAVQRSRAASVSITNATLISDWNPNLDGGGRTVAVLGDRIFVGGDFSTINNWVARQTLASVDSSGALTNWAPTLTGRVDQLLIIGSRLYLGGNFTQVNTATRNGLAALAIPSGATTTWDPSGLASVNIDSMDAAGDVLYVAGTFTSMGGQPRNGLASVDASTGAVTTWDPDAPGDGGPSPITGSVFDLAVGSDAVYIGGSFDKVGDKDRALIAALNLTTGATLPWNPKLDGGNITQIGIVGSTVVFGGWVTCINTLVVGGPCTDSGAGEVPLLGMGGADAVTGAPVLGWIHQIAFPDSSLGAPSGFATMGGVTYMTGEFLLLDGAPVGNVAAFTSTGSVISGWQPIANGPVSSVEVSGSTLTLGGVFTRLNGVVPSYLQQVPLYSAPIPNPAPAPDNATPDAKPTTVSPSVTPEIVSDQNNSSAPTALVPTVTRKPLGDGVVRVSSRVAQKAKPTRNTKSPSETLADAPVVDARTKSVIKLTTAGLPRSTTVRASIKLNGKWVELGIVKVNDKGFAVLPAFTVSRPGTYSVQVTESDAKHVYIKVDASNRNGRSQ